MFTTVSTVFYLFCVYLDGLGECDYDVRHKPIITLSQKNLQGCSALAHM